MDKYSPFVLTAVNNMKKIFVQKKNGSFVTTLQVILSNGLGFYIHDSGTN